MGKNCESWSPAVPETTRVRTRNDAVTGGRGRTGSSAQVAQASWPCRERKRERKRRSRVCGQEVGLPRQEEAGLPGPAPAPAPRHVSHEQRVPDSPSPVGAPWTRSLPSQVSLGAQNKSWVRPGLCPWDLHVQRGNETCRRRTWGGATHMKRCYGNSMTNPEDHIFLFKWVYFDMLVSCAFVHPSYLKMCPAA